jgi:hypothetical protein
MSTSRYDGTTGQDREIGPAEATLERLRNHIAALETELASYASKYGLTDKARELLAKPIVD